MGQSLCVDISRADSECLARYIHTGDPLHSQALAHSRAPLLTHPCPHCSHSRAPGEQWARLCVFTLQGCVQAARLCRGSPVIQREIPRGVLKMFRWLVLDGVIIQAVQFNTRTNETTMFCNPQKYVAFHLLVPASCKPSTHADCRFCYWMYDTDGNRIILRYVTVMYCREHYTTKSVLYVRLTCLGPRIVNWVFII